MAATISFFLGDASGIAEAMTEFLLSFSLYPEGIYEMLEQTLEDCGECAKFVA